jgi:hypothetical protein
MASINPANSGRLFRRRRNSVIPDLQCDLVISRDVLFEGFRRRGARNHPLEVLAHHELKRWRKKVWCVPQLDTEYIDCMWDVLNVSP